jgi:hypothetical protein
MENAEHAFAQVVFLDPGRNAHIIYGEMVSEGMVGQVEPPALQIIAKVECDLLGNFS